MNVQFGRWNFDGKPVEQDYLEKVQTLLLPYGSDESGSHSNGAVSILYFAFHTTKESRRERQPLITASDAILTWDGRLDNRAELIRQLDGIVSSDSTDVSIVAAAYERWRDACFANLVGDWALAIYDPHSRSLTLVKDPVGIRHLYYSFDDNHVVWSTVLDPLVLIHDAALRLDEEYIAGWLSFFPQSHLTPYAAIHAVPPACCTVLTPGSCSSKRHWSFNSRKHIQYSTDREYEEHFLSIFGNAVRRRLRSDKPVLAELSGGMDSSSIVCMADTILSNESVGAPRLDTISYYDNSEPNWNEIPYFKKVEEKRGRVGCHIDVSNQQLFAFENAPEHFAATPSAVRPQGSDFSQFLECLNSHGNRVVLSGIGGDEVTGGVPSPTPELADLLSRAQLRALFHKLKVWALDKRKPWLHLLFQAARGFFPSALVGVPAHQSPAPWLNAKFVKRNYAALRGYPHRLNLFGPTPSFQTNLSTLEVLQRQFACSSPHPGSSLYETRYPYLDRDLLEFMYAVPRGQIVRPGQRRSLMRRALIGIVPDELLNRKRKAFIARSLHATLSANWPSVVKLIGNMQTAELGIVNSERLAETLQNARLGREVAIVSLTRTFELECWLQQLASRDITPHFVARREMDKGWIANSQINVAHTGYLGRGHSN